MFLLPYCGTLNSALRALQGQAGDGEGGRQAALAAGGPDGCEAGHATPPQQQQRSPPLQTTLLRPAALDHLMGLMWANLDEPLAQTARQVRAAGSPVRLCVRACVSPPRPVPARSGGDRIV